MSAAVLVQRSIFIIYFTCMHLPLAGNDTVPISVWRGGDLLSYT